LVYSDQTQMRLDNWWNWP